MKKLLLLFVALPLFFGVLASCSEVKVDVKSLEGKWTIVEVNGEKIEQETMPFIEFDMKENRIHGNSGCNTFNSAIKLDPQSRSCFKMSPAAATMKACLDMELEHKIFGTFDKIAGLKNNKEKSKLDLIDTNGKTVLVLQK